MSSTFGNFFRVTSFGESHGGGVGAIVDGCPPGVPLAVEDIQRQLDRRRPGQSELTTPRKETDLVKLLSGVEDGRTLGTPIAFYVPNRDTRADDYEVTLRIPRPSHADYTYRAKYGGIAARSGGGRASARETIARVAAGVIAQRVLERWGVSVVAWVDAIGPISANIEDINKITREDVDRTIVRCPDKTTAEKMIAEITATRDAHDSVGGIIRCVCKDMPAGWGEPAFDKLEALLAHAMLSIPASRGFELGAGFAAAHMRGSQHNDPFYMRPDGRLGTVTNNGGGIQGGISNGEPIHFRVAFKPVSSIGQPQNTVDYEGRPVVLETPGRHDPCVLPRVVPIVEAMAALVLADAALIQNGRIWP